jgi:hypothetical protein
LLRNGNQACPSRLRQIYKEYFKIKIYKFILQFKVNGYFCILLNALSPEPLNKHGVSGSSSTTELIKQCRKIVKCDTARISKPLDKMFLIIGFNRNTKDDEGVWVNQDNKRIDFDYVQEQVIASGKTKKELIASVKEYQRLCGITWEQYFAARSLALLR